MENLIIKIIKEPLRFSLRVFYSVKAINRLFKNRKELCCHESYFPEKKRKSNYKIFINQIGQILLYGYENEFYFPYGFDVKNKIQMNEYLHYAPFQRRRDSHNVKVHSSTAVLRDKLLFGMFTSYYGINSIENLAYTTKGKLFNLEKKEYQSISDFFANIEYSDLFLKPIDGECGRGIYHMLINGNIIIVNGQEMGMSDVENLLHEYSYLIQPTITQNEIMRSLHHQSLNTIRLITIRNLTTDELEVFPSILRIGTGNAFIDNTSQGGIAVGINLDTGRLKDYGFYKPKYGSKVSVHPDSNIKFSDFKIPYFDECIQQALFLHSRLQDIHSIGWDIAIGEKGPIFIEGNDNWEINGPQICNGGLKKVFLNACGEK